MERHGEWGVEIRLDFGRTASDGEALMTKYPKLYQISCRQQKLIQQLGSYTETAWEWNLTEKTLI